MKIGITCYPVYGGSGVVATELGRALAKRGHEVHFISYALPFRLGHLNKNIFFHEVTVNSYPLFEYPPYTLNLTSKMVDLVRYEKLDILHVHYAIPHATSAVLARQILQQDGIHVPVVTTLHGTDITIVGRDPSFSPVVAYSTEQSDGVTAVSEFLKKETFDHFKLNKEIAVIPNFIDTEQYRPGHNGELKQELCPKREKIVVHVSNFRPVKNVAHVVTVFKKLLDRGLNLKLLLVGDGPDRVSSEHLARRLDICEHVTFMGKQEAVEDILSISDLFLMPSGSETFGLAALEAMACGVPVIASNIGGLPELIENGKNGFLCELGDLDDFTDKAYQLLSDADLHHQFSLAARETAISKFDITQVIPIYESFYAHHIDLIRAHTF